MSNLKISENLFLEKQELNRLVSFLQNDANEVREHSVGSYGVVRNRKIDPTFNNFKIIVGSNNTTLQLQNDSYALDKNNNLIYQTKFDLLDIPTDNQWYWVKIKYQESPIEEGTVSIDNQGNLTGIDTSFTSILRSGFFPTKVTFFNNLNNPSEYTVVSVIDDNTAILAGEFSPENNINYGVIGAFSQGINPPQENKLIYQHDSCQIQFVSEQQNNISPILIEDEEFFVARIRKVGTDVVIEDKRTSLYQTLADLDLSNVIKVQNKLAGIEYIRWDAIETPKHRNYVGFGWSFLSRSWTINSNLRQVSLLNGAGGRFKSTEDFEDGDFDGWRLYTSKGTYYNILESTLQGTSINLILDNLDVDEFTIGESLNVTPDSNYIEVLFRNETAVGRDRSSRQLDRKTLFHINEDSTEIPLVVNSRTSCEYTCYYRYVSDKQTSIWLRLLEDEVGFWPETKYTEDGYFNVLDEDVVRKPYNQLIELLAHPNHYATFAYNIDLGDLLRVNVREFSFGENNINLIVGEDAQIQIFEGTISLATDIIVNLETQVVRSGNRFILIFDADITLNNNDVSIYNGFGGNDAELLYRLTPTDIDYQKYNGQKIVIECFCDGIKWYSTILEKDSSVLGDLKHKMNVPTNAFDVSGLGQSADYYGWALCNGENGTPNIPGHILINQDVGQDDLNQIGLSAGSRNKVIQASNLPKHTHDSGELQTNEDKHTHKIYTRDSGSAVGSFRDANDGRGGNRELSDPLDGKNTDEHAHTHSISGSTGDGNFNNDAIDILPKVYVTAIIARVQKP